MKKKIIFMIINMNIGGTEKALLNMISDMPQEKYEITVLMLEKYGGFLSAIPCHVQVKYLQRYSEMKEVLNDPPLQTIKKLLKKGKIIKSTNILLLHSISKLFKNRNIFYKYILHNQPSLENEYDYAIAYAGPMDFISFFVANKIKAKRKIQWIHFDITQIGFNKKFANKTYKAFDRIITVSYEGKEKLIKSISQLKHKIRVIQNKVNHEEIYQLAEKGLGFTDEYSGVRILTVGRLSKEKGHDLAIHVLAKLKHEGYPVRWYCIGEGNARSEYEQLIDKFGLKNDYILLGSKTNPYPFMKACDLYVQPSRYEGFCITLAEAKCFNKPIISTNFTGAKEQLNQNKYNQIISFTIDELYQAICEFIEYNNLNKLDIRSK